MRASNDFPGSIEPLLRVNSHPVLSGRERRTNANAHVHRGEGAITNVRNRYALRELLAFDVFFFAAVSRFLGEGLV